LEQIQFLPWHASVQTERYLGCKQNLGHPNDLFDLGKGAQPDQTEFSICAVKPHFTG
jgi:hypothetical protein